MSFSLHPAQKNSATFAKIGDLRFIEEKSKASRLRVV